MWFSAQRRGLGHIPSGESNYHSDEPHLHSLRGFLLRCRRRIIVTSGTFIFLIAAGARAQTSSPPPTQQDQSSSTGPARQTEQESQETQSSQSQHQQSQPATTSKDDQDEKSTQNQTGTSNDRLFFTLPNFLTLENAGQAPPSRPDKNSKW